MKRIIALLFCAIFATSAAFAGKKGYKIQLKLSGVKDSMVYLVHYYGKPLPKIYKSDSAIFNKKGIAEFNSNDSTFVGGIYIMLLSDKKTYFEFLLNAGDDISISGKIGDLPGSLVFRNSPENEPFKRYEEFLKTYSERQEGYKKELSQAKSSADTADVRKRAVAAAKELNKYRKDFATKNPNTFLAEIFNALEVVQVPEGDHFLPDGKTKDSTFGFTYFKAHYWDGWNFQDDRLINTPLYDAKLEEYVTRLTLPYPDSLEKEADFLLKKTKGTKDLFKYTLWWLTQYIENSKVMGVDEVFVYLVENYYMKGDAFWLTPEELKKYTDRAQKIAPNVIGNVSPEVKVKNVFTQEDVSLSSIKGGKFYLLVFYSPDCGHCQKEIPLIDSVYKAAFKAKGGKIFTVSTEGDSKKIQEFLIKNKLEEWTNNWDPDNQGGWRNNFDVYSTPTIYLLDEKKIIRGKRLDHSNIMTVIEMMEKRAKDQKK